MADSLPPSYLHIIHNNRSQFEALAQQGKFKPVFIWHLIVLTAVPLLGLLVPCRYGGRHVRRLVFGIVLAISIDTIRNRRALLGANGYMVGLIAAWWCIWAATMLIFHDPEIEFQRIERMRTEKCLAQNGQTVPNGSPAVAECTQRCEPLIWQPYPDQILHRVNWALGLLLNMRGPEWNWRIPSLDPLPQTLIQLNGKERAATKMRSPDARTRLSAAARTFFATYLALDVLKVLMMHDPYFWGVVGSSSLPTPYPLAHVLPLNPTPITNIVIYIYRFFLTGTAVYIAVTFVGVFNPLIFLGLSVAFPNASRALTSTPLDAPWLYTDLFGPLLVPALNHGLAGCWAQWWHQLFRFGFASASHWFISFLPQPCTSRTSIRRALTAFFAFGTSGIIHACGSYTQLYETRPITGTFRFFILQPVGIILQETVAKVVLPALMPRNRIPRWMRRTANLSFATAWLLFSAQFIIDDFARGGFWLAEPLPLSPLRGLGFGVGVEGEGWWCWGMPWFRRWDEGGFWARGVQVM